MNVYPEKIQKLIKQFPFVTDILSAKMEPTDGQGKSRVDDLTIRVQKADGDLMWRRANNIGIGDDSSIFNPSGNRRGQVMRRGEYLFAINNSGKIINRVDWPRNIEERRATGEIYGQSALWSRRDIIRKGETCYSNPIWGETEYLVWATVEAWHENSKNPDAPNGVFGKFHDRSVYITIYGKPIEGFEKLEKESDMFTNLSLDEDTILFGIVEKNENIIRMVGMLDEMCITFQDEVYLNGMQRMLDGKGYWRMLDKQGNVIITCTGPYSSKYITLRDSASMVKFVQHRGSDRLYLQGQWGTLPQIRNLVRTVVRMWQNQELHVEFKVDTGSSSV